MPMYKNQYTHDEINRKLLRHKRMHEVKNGANWKPNVSTTRDLGKLIMKRNIQNKN
jgi:hypothetical protein